MTAKNFWNSRSKERNLQRTLWIFPGRAVFCRIFSLFLDKRTRISKKVSVIFYPIFMHTLVFPYMTVLHIWIFHTCTKRIFCNFKTQLYFATFYVLHIGIQKKNHICWKIFPYLIWTQFELDSKYQFLDTTVHGIAAPNSLLSFCLLALLLILLKSFQLYILLIDTAQLGQSCGILNYLDEDRITWILIFS